MIRHLLLPLAIFSLVVGCSQPEIDPPQPPPQGGEYTPRPAAEPEVDKTFMDSAFVESWHADIAALIEADAAAPHPREIWRYAADFHVDRSRPDPILGDPTIWDAAQVAQPGQDFVATDTPKPRPDEALALEAQDKEWDAAQLWIDLNRLDDAKRCGKELEKEGEWKAVAMVAVHTGDLDALDRATKRMVGADQVSRTQDVASYAFEQGKTDVAKHIAAIHGWKISEILNPYQIRELALKGDTSILHELLDREIAAWEKIDFTNLTHSPGPHMLVADIALLARFDPSDAEAYAKRYLALPHANVLIWTHCGEGCYSEPIRGSLELYQLIRADQTLRELYFARLRTAVDQMFPMAPAAQDVLATMTLIGIDPGGYVGWSLDMWGNGMEATLLTSHLLRAQQLNDRELTAFWVALLDTFPSRHGFDGSLLAFDRELGRCALGLPFDQGAGGMSFSEKFVLEALSGGSNSQMDDTWTAWEKQLPSRDSLEEVSYLFRFLTRGDVSPSREATIRAELGLEIVAGRKESLHTDLFYQFRRSLGAHYGSNFSLDGKFNRVKRALERNMLAQRLRQDLGMPAIDLYPDTDAEYDELMAPSLALLCDKLPAKCTSTH